MRFIVGFSLGLLVCASLAGASSSAVKIVEENAYSSPNVAPINGLLTLRNGDTVIISDGFLEFLDRNLNPIKSYRISMSFTPMVQLRNNVVVAHNSGFAGGSSEPAPQRALNFYTASGNFINSVPGFLFYTHLESAVLELSDGSLVLGDIDGRFTHLTALGEVIQDLKLAEKDDGMMDHPVQLSNGLVIFGSVQGNIYLFDPKTDKLKLTDSKLDGIDLPGTEVSVDSHKIVVFHSAEGKIYFVDENSGKSFASLDLHEKRNLYGSQTTNVIQLKDGTLVTNAKSHVYFINPKTHLLKGKPFEVDGEIQQPIKKLSSGGFFVQDVNGPKFGSVYFFNSKGDLISQTGDLGYPLSSWNPAETKNGLVITYGSSYESSLWPKSTGDKVFVFDLKGELKDQLNTSGLIWQSPSLRPDGTFVITEPSRVLSMELIEN